MSSGNGNNKPQGKQNATAEAAKGTDVKETAAPVAATPAVTTEGAGPEAATAAPATQTSPATENGNVDTVTSPGTVEAGAATGGDATGSDVTEKKEPSKEQGVDQSAPAAAAQRGATPVVANLDESPLQAAPVPAVPAEAEVPEEAAAAVELTAQEKVLVHIKGIFPHTVELSSQATALVGSLEDYISNMAYNQVVEAPAGALRQRRMYHDILSALQAEDWAVQAEIVLYYFATYRDTHFQQRLVHRFVDIIGLQTRDRLRFESLMLLFRVGGDVKSRALVSKEIDFGTLTELFSDNNIKERLLAVFKIQ